MGPCFRRDDDLYRTIVGAAEAGVGPSSLRANGSAQAPPDDRLREAIHLRKQDWIASSLRSSQ